MKETKPFNTDNILLAFYCGDKGSFIMCLFSMVWRDVKSLCIVAGDTTLALKARKQGFQILNSEVVLKNRQKYLIVDSNVKVTTDFINKMRDYENKTAKKFNMRIRCIEGISPLLSDIGEEFTPRSVLDNIPGVFAARFT